MRARVKCSFSLKRSFRAPCLRHVEQVTSSPTTRWSSSRSGAADPLMTIEDPSALRRVSSRFVSTSPASARSRSSRPPPSFPGERRKRAGQRLGAREPEGALRGGVPERDRALEVGRIDRHGGSLDDRAQEPVGRLQRSLARALLREVRERADNEFRMARGVSHQAGTSGTHTVTPSRRMSRLSLTGGLSPRVLACSSAASSAEASSGWVSSRQLRPTSSSFA